MKIIQLGSMKMTDVSDDGKQRSETSDRKKINAILRNEAKRMGMTLSEYKHFINVTCVPRSTPKKFANDVCDIMLVKAGAQHDG